MNINTNEIIINKTLKVSTVLKTLCRILIERKYTEKSIDDIYDSISKSLNEDELLFTLDNKPETENKL